MSVLRGTPDLPVLFKVALLFGTEPVRPEWAAKCLAQSSVKMASAACSKNSGSKAAMAMVWGEDGGGSGTGHVVGDFVPPVKFADV